MKRAMPVSHVSVVIVRREKKGARAPQVLLDPREIGDKQDLWVYQVRRSSASKVKHFSILRTD